jgi:Carboxypeptidase regulatory-like domain
MNGRNFNVRRIALLIAVILLVLRFDAVAGTTGALSGTVLGPNGEPIPGAAVTASSGSGTYRTTTDTDGHFVFPSLLPDTYAISVSAPGFDAIRVPSPTILSDAAQSLTINLRATTPVTGAPPPPPPPPPPTEAPPPPPPTAAPPLTSLLVGYDKAVPDHRASAPYFGRYSYVILHDRGERSVALIASLSSASFSIAGSPMVPTGLEETWRYNLFLMPVWPPTYRLRASTSDEFLSHYDFTGALNLRQHYCKAGSHRSWTLCTTDSSGSLDEGPVIIVFSRPIGSIDYNGALPRAIALDLTGVPESQFPHVIGQLQKSMTLPFEHDSQLPLNWADTAISRAILALGTALEAIIGKAKVYSG